MYGVSWMSNHMSYSSFISINFMIVSSLVAFISIKMYLIILFFNVLKAEWFVPSFWKNIKRDLSTNRKLQIKISHLFLKCFNKLFPDLGILIKLFKSISFLFGAISANRWDIHHAISVFQECPSKTNKKSKITYLFTGISRSAI